MAGALRETACVSGGPGAAQVKMGAIWEFIWAPFGNSFGPPLGAPQIVQTNGRQASLFILIVGPLEASGVTFKAHVGSILGCLLGPPAGKLLNYIHILI